MKSLLTRSLPVLALGSYAAALADVSSSFGQFAPTVIVLFGLASAAGIVFATRTRGLTKRAVPLTLLIGTFLAFVCRLVMFERVAHRTPADWELYQKELAESVARDVSARFDELCRRARIEAERLARHPALAASVDSPDSRPRLLEAFSVLETATVPRPLAEAVGGVTLYDTRQRPLVWTGNNTDLTVYVEIQHEEPRSQTFILEQGVFTYLIVLEPLPDGAGAVSVEIPLAAHRKLNNRYQTDYEVVTTWAGKSITTDYVDVRESAPELAIWFQRSEDRYWGRAGDAPALHFPLRGPSGDLLGICSLTAEDPATSMLEHRRVAQRIAGLFLALAAVVLALILGAGWLRESVDPCASPAGHAWKALRLAAVLWVIRVVLLVADLPLGLGTDADNPAHYASGAFLDFFRSPADFLLTLGITLASTAAFVVPCLASPSEPRFLGRGTLASFSSRVASLAGALALVAFTNAVIRDTWLNSNLPLALPGLLPPDPPRLAVQLGLLCLFVATGLVGVLLLSSADRLSGSPAIWSGRRILWRWLHGGAVFGLAAVALSRRGSVSWFVPALAPLLAIDMAAAARGAVHTRAARIGPGRQFLGGLLLVLLVCLSFYPALAYFEDDAIRRFMVSTVAPTVLHQGESKLYVLREALESIDRMELAGRLGKPERADLAYRVWSGSGLSVSTLSSSVEIFDPQGNLVSRFSMNFPSAEWSWEPTLTPPANDWIIEEHTYPGEPNRPGVLQARRTIEGTEGIGWDIRVQLSADWSNLPFISTRNPYTDLFRSPGTETPLPSPHEELELTVFDRDGSSVFRSSDSSLTLDPKALAMANRGPTWINGLRDGWHHHVLAFSDSSYVYDLSYPVKKVREYAAELTGWAILSALCAAALWVLLRFAGWWKGGSLGFQAREVWTGIGASFYGKLFFAFVLLALVPTVLLAVLARGILVQQLEGDVEQEGLTRAQVVERFVRDYLLFERMEASERGVAAVDDSLLEWVGSLVDSDIHLYSRGELTATSKRELFSAGLLSTRAVPSVFREVVLNRAHHSIHRESVGSFQYFVVSVPIPLERWREPGILSIPLASRQRELDRRVSSLNQTVLLVAIAFALGAGVLAYSLARRIAGPINTLTVATKRVAQGDFDVNIEVESRDEIGALSASFNRMTSDLKRQRQDLERTKKLEAWAEMARQVAHEVKNPLTPIQLASEHLLRVFGDRRVDFRKVLKECTDTILQQVRTLRQISMEFSTFASPAALDMQWTDFGRLVTETLEPYRQAPPPDVTVELDVAPTLPRLRIDRRLMERTLVNLLENAFHALNGQGKVIVRVRLVEDEAEPWVVLSVEDTGEGIDPELKDRVFEPYFSTWSGGTGLGLAIARKVVEEHGGDIALDSEPGKGTLVLVRLPGEPMEPSAV